jgi:hypothetical protein
MMDLETLQYPIGRSSRDVLAGTRGEWLQTIAEMHHELRNAVSGLSAGQLDTPYRPGGWTVRHVVHHYADDHMNSYIRMKLALTEDAPTIKGYFEPVWAELPDARTGDIRPSLALLDGLHVRWVAAWKVLEDSQWQRTFVHPNRGAVTVEQLAALYDWHCRHHVAQILALRERMGF